MTQEERSDVHMPNPAGIEKASQDRFLDGCATQPLPRPVLLPFGLLFY
jgi:hypothetical protein